MYMERATAEEPTRPSVEENAIWLQVRQCTVSRKYRKYVEALTAKFYIGLIDTLLIDYSYYYSY